MVEVTVNAGGRPAPVSFRTPSGADLAEFLECLAFYIPLYLQVWVFEFGGRPFFRRPVPLHKVFSAVSPSCPESSWQTNNVESIQAIQIFQQVALENRPECLDQFEFQPDTSDALGKVRTTNLFTLQGATGRAERHESLLRFDRCKYDRSTRGSHEAVCDFALAGTLFAGGLGAAEIDIAL